MPIRVSLPDGSVREFEGPVTGLAVAESIGPGLAKAALGCVIDGELADLSTQIDQDCALELVTETTRDKAFDARGRALMLHSGAHVMAEAIVRVVPGAELVYGPPLEDRFYYDIAFPADRPLREGDFEAIERAMGEIVKEDRAFTRYELGVEEGLAKLRGEGSKYKLDNAQRAIEGGADRLSWYATGEPGKDFEDLCRGPHVPSTGRIRGFKVLSLASSYWHGDETSDRLTRVYGTAFGNPKDLRRHLEMIEEAKKRDHRVLGRQLGLFHFDEQVGQGLVLWTPAGSIVRKELQRFIAEELGKQGYFEIFTPHIGKLDLYKTSGHFPYYAQSQFPPIVERETLDALATEGCSCAQLSNAMASGDLDGYMLKPMNCPHHIKVFDSQPHSYRDLPVRLAEFGTVYRWEQSGEVGGLTRVRGFTQDDAHLFCTEDQIGDELIGCLSLVRTIFDALGMAEYRVRIGLRDPDSSKYTGDPANWDKAEEACRAAAQSLGAPFSEEPGEAAFYGPKIDFIVRDVIGREWQLGTVQVDYNLPERFDLSYVGADNASHRPVMIHRAPFGSMERFIGVLIEHFAGAFPAWLAPEQVRVLPISDKSNAYAQRVVGALGDRGVRVTGDWGNDRLQAKIKVAASMKIPYLLVVGPRDAEGETVSVRAHGMAKDLGAMGLDAFVEGLAAEIASRGKSRVVDGFAGAAST